MSHFVRRQAGRRPHALALADERRTVTWRQLDNRTDALASALLDQGAGPGDRIAVSSPNRIEVVEIYIAAGKAGAVVCPANHSLPAPEAEHIVANSGPVGVFAEQAVLDRLGPALGDTWRIALDTEPYEELTRTPVRSLPLPRQDDLFAILHTSATTGRAKGVAITHRSIAACYTALGTEARFTADDVMLNPCPLFHGSMVIGLALLAAGGTLVLQREFTPQRFLADVAHHRATRAFLVPSMVRFALRTKAFDDADLSTLTEVMFGGAPMPEELLREGLRRFPCPLRNVYGITEGGGPIATTVFDRTAADGRQPAGLERRLGSAGRMLPGCHIEVQNRLGDPLPPNEIGEICVRGDGVMSGYWHNAEATNATIRNGWLRTGDLGYTDPDDHLYLVDRANDTLIRGGQNVYPAEIERVLAAQPGVHDVAVVGEPSVEWGEVPVAFVAAGNRPPAPVALLKACATELVSYKRPVRIEFVPEIPRSAAGKILRRVLRERLAAGTAPSADRSATVVRGA
ncbi:class I adenylate-forming enzyme family protein [Streptomyces lasiicapitis]|uniref:class I adenylate-forming enzyme family protein n=1 Tax=Streptomyces lasiicapitis TaxID=1923961 RepID=UPI00368E285A